VKTPEPAPLDITTDDLQAWLARMQVILDAADFDILHALLAAYLWVRQALASARVSLDRLRRLFGLPKSEKSRDILKKKPDQSQGSPEVSSGAGGEAGEGGSKKKARRKGKGHGRNGVAAYVAAKRIPVCHQSFFPGCSCPEDHCQGKVYPLKDPSRVLRVVGQPSLVATIWEADRWRCHLCEKVFTADLPAEAGTEKYDATAVAMIALLHFANGFAFHRLEQHQASLGVPLPASLQSTLVSAAYHKLLPVLQALIRCAAQCEILHNDDTGMRVLSLLAAINSSQGSSDESSKGKRKRTGIHTTGIVAVTSAYLVVLYFTGRKHAGENLADVLQYRDPNRGIPIHMSDGLDHNNPAGRDVQTAKCIAHGRRQFVDIVTSHPEECRRVVEDLAQVYQVDALAREKRLDPEERLLLHQEKSGPVMARLHQWLAALLEEKVVEPNSNLGNAIEYVLKRWEPLTLFLRRPGAPLDNNIVERALKKAIRHRRNSLFYKTERGAAVGDLFMSLIETCALNNVDAFHYLTALLRNADRLQQGPECWMPWNYRAMLKEHSDTDTHKDREVPPANAPPPGPLPEPTGPVQLFQM
jgi:transposase